MTKRPNKVARRNLAGHKRSKLTTQSREALAKDPERMHRRLLLAAKVVVGFCVGAVGLIGSIYDLMVHPGRPSRLLRSLFSLLGSHWMFLLQSATRVCCFRGSESRRSNVVVASPSRISRPPSRSALRRTRTLRSSRSKRRRGRLIRVPCCRHGAPCAPPWSACLVSRATLSDEMPYYLMCRRRC